MRKATLEDRRAHLNQRLRDLEEQFNAALLPERPEIDAEIHKVEEELRDLEVELRNRASMDADSEA